MIASLPMYDRPENAASHDALWAGIRDALRTLGGEAPEALDRQIGIWDGWGHPELVLGQVCGLPYRLAFHDKVELVANFDYGLPETPPGFYRSHFVVRADDPRGSPEEFSTQRLAYNEAKSHSGWGAPQLWAKARGFFFRPELETGSHRASARAVASGQADIAAIDTISWRGIERWEPEVAAKLKIVGQTDATPGQALISAKGADADRTAKAVENGFAALPAQHRETLGIGNVVRIPKSAYLDVAIPPSPAEILAKS